jgi:hypothetical protein
MSRGAGRKQNVPRQPEPGTPEGDDIGMSERQDPSGSPIPGLTGNIINYETVRQAPAVPDETFDEYRGMMAHGVPNDSETTEERALMERDGTLAQHQPMSAPVPYVPRVRPTPVPVYLVEEGAAGNSFISAAPRNITVPPATGSLAADPARLCGRDPKRTKILLLNEDTANNIRFAQRPSDLVNGGGALLPWPTNSYLRLETQDELFALAIGTAPVVVSVIQEFEQEL